MPGESVDIVARTYHTVDGVPHAEGETYPVTDRVLADTLRAIGFVSIEGWTESGAGAPPPVLTALAPATVALGSPSFTVHVQGTGFAADAVIVFSDQPEPTTFVSATEVTTGVNMDVWKGAATVPVAVRNGTGLLSNALSFTFTAARRAR